MELEGDASREVLIALLQVIPALLIAYILIDPPGTPTSRAEADARIRTLRGRMDRAVENLLRIEGEAGNRNEFELQRAREEIVAARAEADADDRRQERPTWRFVYVITIALIGLIFAVNGIVGIRPGPPYNEVLGIDWGPTGGFEMLLSLMSVIILVAEIAAAGVDRIADRAGLYGLEWRLVIYGLIALVCVGWIVYAFVNAPTDDPLASFPRGPESSPPPRHGTP